MDQRTMLDGPAENWLPRDAAYDTYRLIRTRWVGGGMVLFITAICVHILGLPLPEAGLYTLGIVILLYNGILLGVAGRASRADQTRSVLHFRKIMILQVVLDWLSMAVFIHLTGGITSPAIFLFIIHVVLVTIILRGQSPYTYVLFAVVMILLVTLLESVGILPHYQVIPGMNCDLCHNNLYAIAQVVFFSVALFATVFLTNSVMRRLWERERQVMGLLQTTRSISSTLELSIVLENLARGAAEALAVPGASIRILDVTGERLTMVASYGLSRVYLEKGPVELSGSYLDREALSGKTVLVDQAEHDPRVQYPKEMAEEGIQSILVAPVIGRKPLGVLRAYSNLPNHFTMKDADFLQAIAHQSAAAIENAQTYAALQQAEQRRTQFVRQVTHELRSPVTGAQSLLRVLLHNMAGELTPQQQDIVGRLENRMGTLLELITDLLALAASKSFDQRQELETITLQPLIQATVDSFKHQAAEKDVQLDLTMSETPLRIHATEDGLKRVAENLIGNAIKYTLEGGSVTVNVTKETSCAVLTVTDTGIGIPDEALERLGEEFYRAPNVRHSGIPGTGLGIAIVKQFVASFGGLMSIQSTVGTGTTITITLPLN
ncbi:MAG: GAF domain-containing protein [Anaerolineaceae bacterium]|nr:GAF domain-containing protein [Anaerolineaceae bacterium]